MLRVITPTVILLSVIALISISGECNSDGIHSAVHPECRSNECNCT
jgi:hypothetical protein